MENIYVYTLFGRCQCVYVYVWEMCVGSVYKQQVYKYAWCVRCVCEFAHDICACAHLYGTCHTQCAYMCVLCARCAQCAYMRVYIIHSVHTNGITAHVHVHSHCVGDVRLKCGKSRCIIYK